jgi:hypothetical protein
VLSGDSLDFGQVVHFGLPHSVVILLV